MSRWPTSTKAEPPAPEEIREARARAGLTQSQAAALVDRKLSIWQKWEGGRAPMPPLLWSVFRSRARPR